MYVVLHRFAGLLQRAKKPFSPIVQGQKVHMFTLSYDPSVSVRLGSEQNPTYRKTFNCKGLQPAGVQFPKRRYCLDKDDYIRLHEKNHLNSISAEYIFLIDPSDKRKSSAPASSIPSAIPSKTPCEV